MAQVNTSNCLVQLDIVVDLQQSGTRIERNKIKQARFPQAFRTALTGQFLLA
jgi:2-C-methyl-D-erythritol 4-phosphate cytidylyltransferase